MKRLLASFCLLMSLSVALQAQVVITEIMYNPPESGNDSLEYIELHNPTNAAIDLEGWAFSLGVTHTFTGTSIPAHGYLLTAFRASAMQNQFGKTAVQWASGALSNSGEPIVLKNAAGAVVDSVAYDDALPWPPDAYGGGYSLELCDPASDNAIVDNWRAAAKNTGVTINGKAIFGTPGAANTVTCNSAPTDPYPVRSIAEMTNENADGVADSLGLRCKIEGTVYGINYLPVGLSFTLIDGQNRGIKVFRGSGQLGYTVAEGDKITVKGKIDQFNGLTEIVPDSIGFISAGNPLVAPATVATHSEATESQLIRIKNLTLVDPAQWTTGVGLTGFTVRAVAAAHPTDTIVIRIDNDVDLYNEPAPVGTFDLTGIGGQFDANAPFSSGYQIFPRYRPDIEASVGTHESLADFSQNVRLAPNPASATLRLTTDLAFDRVQILSPAGQTMRAIASPDFQEIIDIQSLASGLYFLRFEKDGATWTTRFVKI